MRDIGHIAYSFDPGINSIEVYPGANELEKSMLELAHWQYLKTGEENLCLAGGVALNCVMNAVLRDKGPFKNIWVQPASGDAGTALGAALWVDIQERKSSQRNFHREKRQKTRFFQGKMKELLHQFWLFCL